MAFFPIIALAASVPFASIIDDAAKRHNVPALLVVALIKKESNFKPRAVSGGNYGLMQIRVSKTSFPEYLGKEHLLFNPKLNISLGVKMLAFWRRYHQKHCDDKNHYWWGHYQHGKNVEDNRSGERVLKIWQKLKK